MIYKSILCATCACLAVVSFNVDAAPVSYYQSLDTGGYGMKILTSTNSVNRANQVTYSHNATVGLDTGASEMWYENYSLYVEGFSLSFTDNFTAGFGEVVSITTTLSLNAIQNNLSSPTDRQALIPSTDGQFIIDPSSVRPQRDFLEITGGYNIVGPTETVTGNFSLSSIYNIGEISYRTLFASLFPEKLFLLDNEAKTLASFFVISGPIYSGVIDGIDYTTSIDQLIFDPANNIPLILSEVSVPAAAWLFGSGLLGLAAVARRKA